MKYIKALAIGMCFIIMLSSVFSVPSVAASAEKSPMLAKEITDNNYYAYFDKYSEEHKVNGCYEAAIQTEISEANGKICAVMKDSLKTSEWKVTVPEEGLYSVELDYLPLEANGRDIEISLEIDGKAPFNETENISLSRVWKDDGIAGAEKDAAGNDMRPTQIENMRWVSCWLSDKSSMYVEPYLFFLSAGEHIVKITLKREAVAISGVAFGQPEKLQSYKEYIKANGDKKTVKNSMLRFEAEKAYEKNSAQLYPVYDRSNASVLPNDPYVIRLNTIGQSNWSTQGQWISWKPEIKEKGLYRISFKARQDLNQGMISYRTLMINGEIPFSEATNIEFSYSSDWYIKTLGDEEPLLIYLEPGDVITLECPAGKLSEALRKTNQAVLDLNEIYRRIIIVTGTSPDQYRDYSLESHIPDLLDKMSLTRDNLNKAAEDVLKITGKSNSQISTLHETAAMLNDFIKDSSTIIGRFDSFKSNIESLGSLVQSFGTQPLELDCILLSDPEQELPKAKASFIDNLVFSFKKFASTFVNEYDTFSVEGKKGKKMEVWISTGRDQAQILSNIITSYYEPEDNVNVKLSLVDTGATLIQATLAGRGPDLALAVGTDTPVNLAMRGALVDLSKFNTDEIYEDFPEAAWTPFYYNNGLYALPETLGFNMIFYRTDVFEQLGISVPETWEDFYNVMEILQASNLQVGIQESSGGAAGVSASIPIFDSFLFQSGGTYYNKELSKTLLDTPTAFAAFTKWVELYSRYGLARDFDFFNRFRSGEMPIGISGYATYNQIYAAAPEIRGLWKMAPIPGTKQEDGSIDRSEPGSGSCCIMLKSAVDKGIEDEAFRFMSWWVSSETQTQYAKELENTLGVAARYSPASTEVLSNLGWNDEELSALLLQMSQLQNVNQIPGSYLIPRALTSAFRSAVDNGTEPFRELDIYNKDINNEISRKRKEFGLDK